MNAGPDPPLGEPVDWIPATPPQRCEHAGRRVLLRPLDPQRDAGALYALSHPPVGDPSIWTYLPYGPYRDLADYRQALEAGAAGTDPLMFVIADETGEQPLGTISYMSIVPEHGSVELGHLWFGATLRRTPAATEAVFLLIKHAFDELGYRRLEWKCNSLNGASRAAALRFGFAFEGLFVQHRVVKGHNRDTAWFALTDKRWPQVREGFEAWLAPDNFTEHGHQRRSLRELTGAGVR